MFILKSTFENNERMPAKYANHGVTGGENISPEFYWEGAPEGTKSFALSIVDYHPAANEFVHWLVVNIAANVNKLTEGASEKDKLPSGSLELNTTYAKPGYGGPRPPVGSGKHPYVITIYALNVQKLDLSQDAFFEDFLEAISDKVLAEASLTGLFDR